MKPFSKLAVRGPARELRKAINELQDAVLSLRIAPGVGYKVKQTATSQILEIHPGKTQAVESPSTIKRAAIIHCLAHYWICMDIASGGENDYGTTTGSPYYVHRPRTTWTTYDPLYSGYATTEPEVDTGDTARYCETEVFLNDQYYTVRITEELYPLIQGVDVVQQDIGGTRIYVAKDPGGVAGIVPEDDRYTGPIGSYYPPTNEASYIDLNIAGSHWAVRTALPFIACVNNELKPYVIVASGEPPAAP